MAFIRLGNKPPLVVAAGVTVTAAAIAMVERKVGAAAVEKEGRVVGIITERDVLQKVVGAQRDPAATSVSEVMSSPALTIGVKTTVADAAAMMRKHHIRHLLVLDQNEKLVGILALRYLLYDLMDDMERNVGDLMGYIMTDSPGG
jgi:CBS domain-containing protein